MRKEQPFSWTDECQKAFEKLKEHLISAQILIYPEFSKSFLLYTDAFSFGLAAVLSQKDDDRKEHVVAYASRRTDQCEVNFHSTELECLAVK